MTSESCGRCHTEIYQQWKSSAHHFSSFNNQWYRKSIEYMQDVVGTHAVEVVRRLPRSRGVLQRPLRPADQGADRHAGGAGGSRLHVVPRDHQGRQHDGPGRLRDRVPAAARSRRQRQPVAALRARSADLHRSDSRTARSSSSRSIASRRRSSARAATRSISTCRSTAIGGSAASTTTTTGRHPACRARARARSTTRRSRRSAPTATCRSWRRPILRRRTARSARTDSPRPTPRCRS